MLQKMSLTPQMRQAIQLLGMSQQDLSEYIDSAVSANPFLQKYQGPSPLTFVRDADSDSTQRIQEETNPRLNLVSQIRLRTTDDNLMRISEYLIFEMDDNGYLGIDEEEAARDLSADVEEVEKSISLIQGMEPAGIGARDIRECLQIQLERSGKKDSLEYRIVDGYLPEVAKEDVQKISKALKAEARLVREAIKNIKKLNPRPAANILSVKPEQVTPDLIVHIEKSKVRLELNRSSLPQLKLYNPYEKDMDIIKDADARNFMKENMDAAKGLMDNLKRREDTICRVAEYIISYQRDALLKDGHDIRTLTIKEIAGALDFHPSTISRAISNKYIQVNDRAISLTGLLSHGIKKENGEIESKTAVKDRIKKLVKDEDSAHPLSDAEIEKKLKEEGIKIARRTIVKYRKALRVLPAYLRKKVKSV
ncbi:MAG: RNA polymerase factor sigma-54 [Candidatus Omnitrophica bacterium]|nr:RNA polymerase factor sigma-54 [Candidatus Omnitrophota bacterium]